MCFFFVWKSQNLNVTIAQKFSCKEIQKPKHVANIPIDCIFKFDLASGKNEILKGEQQQNATDMD